MTISFEVAVVVVELAAAVVVVVEWTRMKAQLLQLEKLLQLLLLRWRLRLQELHDPLDAYGQRAAAAAAKEEVPRRLWTDAESLMTIFEKYY